MVGVSKPGRQTRENNLNTFQITNDIILIVQFVFKQQLKRFICVCQLDRDRGVMLTLSRCWERRKLHLRQRRSLGIHQEVVKERHLFFHLFNFIPVFVQDVLSYKFWALRMKLKDTRPMC